MSNKRCNDERRWTGLTGWGDKGFAKKLMASKMIHHPYSLLFLRVECYLFWSPHSVETTKERVAIDSDRYWRTCLMLVLSSRRDSFNIYSSLLVSLFLRLLLCHSLETVETRRRLRERENDFFMAQTQLKEWKATGHTGTLCSDVKDSKESHQSSRSFFCFETERATDHQRRWTWRRHWPSRWHCKSFANWKNGPTSGWKSVEGVYRFGWRMWTSDATI